MIHIFNRAELFLTPSLEESNRIQSVLEASHIEYTVKTKTNLGSSTARDGRAGRIPGVSPNSGTLYAIYVRREDLEYAAHLI